MNGPNEQAWLCWFFEQGFLHLKSESKALQANLQAFLTNRAGTVIPLAVFDSGEAAALFAQELRLRAQRRQPQELAQ